MLASRDFKEFGAKGFRFSCWERIMPVTLYFIRVFVTFRAGRNLSRRKSIQNTWQIWSGPDFCAKHFSKTLLNKSHRVFVLGVQNGSYLHGK